MSDRAACRGTDVCTCGAPGCQSSLESHPTAAPVKPETLTDEQIRELHLEMPIRDPLRRDCITALSTDAARRYPHETSEDYRARKTRRDAARTRIADAINDAINARRAKERIGGGS